MGGIRIPDQDSERVKAFREEQELRHRQSRVLTTWCICIMCGFRCTEEDRKAKNYTVCPQCGSNKVRTASLPYNVLDPNGVRIPENPPPTSQEIAQLERQRIPTERDADRR
jgi:predicted Zn-ribbon and HTH transcriptional regulator